MIPVIVTVFDVTSVLTATPVWSVKVNASGVVSVSDVTFHTSETPPIVTVALLSVAGVFADVSRTAIVCPGDMVPDVAHAPPLMLICGLPAPVTLTLTGTIYPEGVILADVVSVFSGTFVWSTKLKADGMASFGSPEPVGV